MLLIFGIILFCDFALGDISNDITRCRVNDGNCLIKSIEYVGKKYANGNPDLYLVSIDPFNIKEMSIIQSPQSPVRINLFFKNILATGMKNTKYHNITSKLDKNGNYRFEAFYRIPSFVLDSDYTVDGSVLILPVTGKGRSKINLRNVNVRLRFIAVPFIKNGKEYMKIDRFKFSFTTEKMTVNFENLFNGDKVLGDTMNQFINDNWVEILEEMKPAITDNLSKEFKEAYNRVLTQIPFSDLFLLDS